MDRENYSHPEKIYKDLTWVPNGILSDELMDSIKGHRLMGSSYHGDMKEEELCWSCGWTVYNELLSSYGSRLRILHTRSNVGIWEVGSRWLIRDQPNDESLGNDFITQEYLRNHLPALDIPLVKTMQKLSEPSDKVVLTLMSRAQGVGLDTIWHTLSPEQKTSYKNQLGNAIRLWRQFTSPVAKNVDGGLLEDCIIGNCHRRRAPTCKKMGRTTVEWLANLEKDLRYGLSLQWKTKDPVLIEAKFQELKENFPKSKPYVLTHGDLNFSNIIVKDDKIQAIIDWEFAGYLPWWAERWLSLIGGTQQSGELFKPLWADLGIEMDEDTFRREVMMNVAPVIDAWRRATLDEQHPDAQTMWLRPAFCKCKPFAGRFKWTDLGNQPDHILKDM